MTKIKSCGCKGNPDNAAQYQNTVYGSGNRVYNVSYNGKVSRCTVCGKEVIEKPEKEKA